MLVREALAARSEMDWLAGGWVAPLGAVLLFETGIFDFFSRGGSLVRLDEEGMGENTRRGNGQGGAEIWINLVQCERQQIAHELRG